MKSAPPARPILRRWSSSAIALLMLSAAGCSLAPEYRQPDLSVPVHLGMLDTAGGGVADSGAHDTSIDALSAEERQFLREFSPHYDLSALVDRALGHNRDLRLAGLRVEEARAMYRIQKADERPSVTAGVLEDRAQINNATENARYGDDLSLAGVGVSNYELDFFGRVRSLSESAKHEYLATTYARQTGRAALIAEVARTYVAERAAAEIQNTLQEVYGAELETLQVLEHEELIGATSGQDVRSQRDATEHARLKWQQSQVEHVQVRHALQLITGYAADDLQLGGTVADLATSSGEATAWFANAPSEVLRQRPDIRQAEEKLRAANAAIGAARAAFFPSIQLTTAVGVASPGLRGLFDASTGAWLFSPQMTLPIFSGGRIRANLDLAQVRKHMAVAEYEKAVQSAFREVADALVAREQLVDQLRTEQSLLEVAQQQARQAAKRLDAGWSEQSTVLVAQIRRAQMNLDCIQVRQATAINWLDLYRAFYGVHPAP